MKKTSPLMILGLSLVPACASFPPAVPNLAAPTAIVLKITLGDRQEEAQAVMEAFTKEFTKRLREKGFTLVTEGQTNNVMDVKVESYQRGNILFPRAVNARAKLQLPSAAIEAEGEGFGSNWNTPETVARTAANSLIIRLWQELRKRGLLDRGANLGRNLRTEIFLVIHMSSLTQNVISHILKSETI